MDLIETLQRMRETKDGEGVCLRGEECRMIFDYIWTLEMTIKILSAKKEGPQ